MVANRIRLVKLCAETGLIKGGARRPENLFDYALEKDGDQMTIEEMELTPDNKAKAVEWLAQKRNTCERIQGFAGAFYRVEAYGIEYFEVDEDGDFIEGSDYDGAADEK